MYIQNVVIFAADDSSYTTGSTCAILPPPACHRDSFLGCELVVLVECDKLAVSTLYTS